MIGEILNSKESVNVLGYDFGSTNKKDQRIKILASEGVYINPRSKRRLNQNWNDEKSLEEFKRLGQEVARDLSYQFDAQSSQSERIKKTTGHIAIPFSPADRPRLKNDAFKVQLANEYRVKMGIVDTQWVLTEHLGTHAPHLHLGYNRVKFDGTVISSSHERIRSMIIAAEISEKYGLAKAGEAERRKQSLSKTQQSFHQLRDMVREALKESCSMDEFELNLKSRGISLRMSERDDEKNSLGLSYAMIDDPTISAKGSKLDRSALSYVKVTATLDSNAAKRTAEEEQLAKQQAQQERAKASELNKVYGQLAPAIQLIEKAVGATFLLYNDTVHAGITLGAQTREKYSELTKTWDEYQHLDQERQKATTDAMLINAIGGLLMLLNPIAGLVTISIGLIAKDILLSNIREEKEALAAKVEELKSDLDTLEQQKNQIKIEKLDRLDDYLRAKEMRDEFREEKDNLKNVIHYMKIDKLKKDFPFNGMGHIQYIIHGPMDASIFRSFEKEDFDKNAWEELNVWERKVEEARLMLKHKGYMVASDRGPKGLDGFYERLLAEQEYKNYRIGSMQIQPDGKIVFGQEIVFGEAQETAPAFVSRKNAEQKPTPAVEKKPEQVATPPEQKQNYEIVKSFTADYNNFRIKKKADGTYYLQHLDYDRSVVENGRYTKQRWYNKAVFTTFEEVGKVSSTFCFKIKDFHTGKTRYVNQYGSDLSSKQLQRLGISSGKGKGGRSL